MSSLGAVNSVKDTSDIYLNQPKMIENKKEARKRSIQNQKFLIAINEKNFEEVNHLVNSVDINFRDQDGWTPLHWAVETGCINIVEILLKNSADIHSKNNDLETPFDIAKQSNCFDIINILEDSLHATSKSRDSDFNKCSEWNKKSTSSQDQDIIWINPVHGYIYQLKVLMLFLHRGLSCKYSFRLGTEIKEAKKFDDLVFEYVEGDKKIYRLLQAKHKFDESKKITVDKLLGDTRGDYSLVKYFNSFQACKTDNFFKDSIIKDVIICTNIDFDFDDLKTANIDVVKLQETDDILDMKSDEKESTRYKFTTSILEKLKLRIKSKVSDHEIQDFLNHLVFAVNQPNEEELGQIVKEEISREIGLIDTENAYNKLLSKMMDLSLGKEQTKFLTHDEGKKFFDDLKKDISIWFNVQDPVSSFTGRLHYLKKMHKFLMKQFQLCISGMGGVGKTELVRKYILEYGFEFDYQVIWINAESYRSAVDSFQQLASDKLNIRLISADGKEKHITSIVSAVYQFFSKGKSLFIFDNAEKYKCEKEFDSGIDQFWPCLPANGVKPKIIITSRNQKWPESIKTIVLEALSVDEARELVEKKLSFGNDKEKELIIEFVEKLQFLPLALQQAISYIKMQKEKLACTEANFGIGNYLDSYSQMTHELLDFKFSEDSDSNYDKSVFAAWNITLNALNEKENGQDALSMLNIIAYCLPDNIPIEFLLSFSSNEEALSAAIRLLKQYSMISVQHKSISIHRLVQQVIRTKLQQQGDEVKVLKSTLNFLNKGQLNMKHVDHVISVWTFTSKHSQLFEEYARLSTIITEVLMHCARYDEATSICNKISTLLEAYPNNSSVLVPLLTIKNNLAMCVLEKGEHERALQELQNTYERQVTIILEPTDPRVLGTQINIIAALQSLDREKEALELCYKLLDICKAKFSEDCSEILILKYNISSILFEQGKREEALSMMQEIYETRKKNDGDLNIDTIKIREQMAMFFKKMNRTDECLKILEEVCSSSEAILPLNHPDILCTKTTIADVLRCQNKYTSALKIYEDLLVLKEGKLGNDHHEVIYINVRIVQVLEKQSRYEKALVMCKDIFNKLRCTSNLPKITDVHETIALIYCGQKKFIDAVEVYKDLLDKQISVFGNDHSDVLKTRRLMYKLLIILKKYDAALECNLEILRQMESIHGKNHQLTLDDKIKVGRMYFRTKDYDKSLNIFQEVLKVQEVLLGKNHDAYQKTKADIAVVLETQRIANINDEYAEKFERKLKEKSVNIQAIVDEKDDEGLSMLHKALNNESERMVHLLLNNGAEIFVTSNKGNTPLHIAVLHGHENFVKILLHKINPKKMRDFVDAQTSSSGSSALHVAAKKGRLDIVKDLLKNRATFCIKDKNGKTPLDLSNDQDVVNFLKMIQELFEMVKQSKANKVVCKLEKLSPEELLAVTCTRNERGSTLAQVAILNKHKRVAAQILGMVQKSKVN